MVLASGDRHCATVCDYRHHRNRSRGRVLERVRVPRGITAAVYQARTLTFYSAAGDCHRPGDSRRARRCQDGKSSYLLGLLLGAGRRGRAELLRNGVEAIGTLLAMGIILDVVFQLVLTTRCIRRGLGGWTDPHLPPLRGVQSTRNKRNGYDGEDLRNAAFLHDRDGGGR
jgi:hypothetical protein